MCNIYTIGFLCIFAAVQTLKKKNMKIILSSLLLVFALSMTVPVHAQKGKNKKEDSASTLLLQKEDVLTSTILTAEEQAKLTPESVLETLKQGNKDFTEDNLTIRNNSQRVRDSAVGQYPKAVVLSCLDSRVPVEDVFHRGIGDIFVARVAGNIINEDILGSLEYACKVSGSKLVVVLGHEYCGAIKSAIKDVKLGNITPLLTKIQPAVIAAKRDFKGEQSVDNPEFVDAVCKHNVSLTVDEIRERSYILKDMEAKGEIKIIGAVYDMETGVVTFQ